MNKKKLILQFFQKSDLLTVSQPSYAKAVLNLFNWLISADKVMADKTSKFFSVGKVKANIICRQPAIIAGLEEIEFILKTYPQISFKKKTVDGQQMEAGEPIATLTGDSRAILALERTILNLLQRLSGIASLTNRLIKQLIAKTNTPPFIAATRKTNWGPLDKKAVAVGGGLTHRLNLADEILIKDNHLKLLSPTEAQAVKKALALILPRVKKTLIEIEVTTPAAFHAAIAGFLQDKNSNYLTIMFDNWQPDKVAEMLKHYRQKKVSANVFFEASGGIGIEEKDLNNWGNSGVDLISIGVLTHSAPAADLSLTLANI